MAKQAAEIIAFHFCADLAEMRDQRYQPGTYTSPAVYVVGQDYYCAPAAGKLPGNKFPGQPWQPVATYYGRTVYESVMEGVAA